MRTFSALFIASLSTTCELSAQEQVPPSKDLVRNGGFEFVDKEPSTYDQLDKALGWSNVTIGYSELFTKEAPAKTIGIPVNDYGKMDPKEGEHYAGFFAWKDDLKMNFEGGDDPFVPGWSSYSEYVISELLEPLVEGREYEISFWVALAGNSDRAVSGIGAYCSEEPLKQQHRRFLREKPQVSHEKIVGEKGVWVEVKNTFVADGGERFITIGTYPAAGFDTKRCVETLDNQYAYYYLDQVSLKQVAAQ
jgi:hypothetical protein